LYDSGTILINRNKIPDPISPKVLLYYDRHIVSFVVVVVVVVVVPTPIIVRVATSKNSTKLSSSSTSYLSILPCHRAVRLLDSSSSSTSS
jgi:hypothetical protein